MILANYSLGISPKKPKAKIDAANFFGRKGLLSTTFKDYEYRPQQGDMAKSVEEAVEKKFHLIVEAGTGVGKSFAYLVPLIDFAVGSNKKAIVSTNTISLQEQLVKKDIPFLKSILPFEFKASLVKGRANYLCTRRLNRAFSSKSDLFESKEELGDLEKILAWSKVTDDGSLSDFDKEPSGKVWDKVCSDYDACLGKKCPYRQECFFQRARKAMDESNLLVVNHHLFFSDLSLRRSEYAFLPNYECVVFDEAHTIEDVATEHLGFEVSNFKLKYLLDSLYNPSKKKGFLASIKDGEGKELVLRIRKDAGEFFSSVLDWLGEDNIRRVREPNFIEDNLSDSLKVLTDFLTERLKRAKSKEE
ncbi:MAG: ATP-dependent DNA helicase [Candidatus Omnitrophota bacterium]